MSNRAEFLFSEVYNAVQKISEKFLGSGSQDGGIRASESRICIEELEAMLQKDKEEFQVAGLKFIICILPPSLMSNYCLIVPIYSQSVQHFGPIVKFVFLLCKID